MHRAVIAFVLSVGLIAAWAAPAAAVSTRAEYVAQVDPICRENLGQWKRTNAAGAREYKKWVRLTNKGTLKAWERQTHKYARSLKQHVRVHRSLTDRVSVVPPAAEDAQLVADWLRYRRTYERLANSSAKAFDAFKFRRSDKLIGRANKAGETEWRIASSLGVLESCK